MTKNIYFMRTLENLNFQIMEKKCRKIFGNRFNNIHL